MPHPSTANDYVARLTRELVKLPTETEWVEFKENNADPQEIAEYISALSNAATLCGKSRGYLVWGVNDTTHEIVGTGFDYRKVKKGNEELEAWLARMINPKTSFRFYSDKVDGKRVTLLEIPAAVREPTKFGTVAFIRVGSNKKPLSKFPDREAELWRLLDTTPYEIRLAAEDLPEDDVLSLLDYPSYYRALGPPIPTARDKIFADLENEEFIVRNDAGGWGITNLGALMIAVDLTEFRHLAKRAVRVIQYRGDGRLDGVQERSFTKGYAISHEEVVQFVMAIIPKEEVIDGAIRHNVVSFPEIAVRELTANMMVHQALDISGTSPMVEVFDGRIEFSNAGAPLVEIDRIVDTVPQSRNEAMAGFMHKCGICEERGSGYDKIVTATSSQNLLAPRVENQSDKFTKATIYSKIPFDLTSKEDRVRTCYMQACLASVTANALTNADVRNLFALEGNAKVKASRVIKDTVDAGLIKPVDPDTAPRYMRYVPFWA
ncbi:MAG: putative DNA binding domain-containing protein [Eggerthellaceae bacterium]|nr:putative DNA binding domain-containing protein [Eggerthellaceae bacterium]